MSQKRITRVQIVWSCDLCGKEVGRFINDAGDDGRWDDYEDRMVYRGEPNVDLWEIRLRNGILVDCCEQCKDAMVKIIPDAAPCKPVRDF